MNDAQNLVELSPGVFEPMSNNLIDRCNGNLHTAGFFHSLGRALGGESVNNRYLKTREGDCNHYRQQRNKV